MLLLATFGELIAWQTAVKDVFRQELGLLDTLNITNPTYMFHDRGSSVCKDGKRKCGLDLTPICCVFMNQSQSLPLNIFHFHPSVLFSYARRIYILKTLFPFSPPTQPLCSHSLTSVLSFIHLALDVGLHYLADKVLTSDEWKKQFPTKQMCKVK